MTTVPIIKIAMMGGGGQGKSALVLQFITGTFLSDYDPTIEDTYRQNVTSGDSSALLEILDTAGQEVFWSMQEQWIRDSQVFYLVYSVCSHDGFKLVDELRNRIYQVKNSRDIPILLVGTQKDLSTERVISRDQGQQKATQWECEFIEVSAKTSENLGALFDQAIPLYQKYFGDKIVQDAIQNQGQSPGCCSCICGEDGDEIDDIEDDGDAFKTATRKENKIQFFKTEELPPDIIPNPILSLKNFRIARTFAWSRFFKAFLAGIFLPIVIIFQTIAFLTYSEKNEPSFYPEEYQYDDIHYALLWDYLGMVVGRKPGQDPETIKDRKWFLRQTGGQKLKRVSITIFVCLVFVVCCYNISTVGQADATEVSLMESVGPFVLFWIVWFLLAVWIGYEQKLKPPIPAPTRLRSLTLFFGEDFSHRSSVYKFVRAYEQSRTNNRWKLNKPRTFFIICLGALYAAIPGLTRLTIGDSSEASSKGAFFSKGGNLIVQIGALIVNFIMITSILYCVEIQYKKQFDNYKSWMTDLTMLLNKSDEEHDALAKKKDEEIVDIQTKGTALSKDLFISLTRRQNALGWLEIRSFLGCQGAILFGEQELPTLWMIVITSALAIWCVYRSYFFDPVQDNPLESVLFNGVAILTILCALILLRIMIISYQFEGIQTLQEKLVAEQKFFMRCNRPYDDMMIDSHAVGMLEMARSKSKSKLANNPLHPAADPDDYKDNQALEEDDGAITSQKTDLTEIELAGKPIANEKVETLTVPLKGDYGDDEEDADESQPFLGRKKFGEDQDNPLTIIKGKVTKIEDVNRYSYNVNFIDDTLVLIKKKDIYPRLFKLKLNSILSKFVTGVAIAVVATAFKLFLNNDFFTD